ncbi:hypothetical protein NQ315_001971 [Exocentrus adspersus]|uniref:cyclin-dependent kinase n=1 Tax=Exocentrus adspersus TaxID=1586481 RepID=A0AAV8WA30_9CUCU|nr:hypothetical protein NQ315_001971 [Exocentrus adspersus]
MSESAYNSPLLTRRLTDSCCSSPARSIRSHHIEDLTDSDGEGEQLFTETPGTPDQTVISGWLKFRDNKKGSYGTVSKCEHIPTGETVAVKKFLETEENATSRKMAVREIRMLKRLKHENLVTMVHSFRHRKRFFIVFEYLERTVYDELQLSPVGLGERKSKEIIFQVLRAISYCHKNRIIHRDIKPENILISSVGVVKVCDFGFARILSISPEVCTEYVATRWYRAPELVIKDRCYGTGVDIWAIGCLSAEMVNGMPLFPGETDIDQFYLIVKLLGTPCRKHQKLLHRNANFRKIYEKPSERISLEEYLPSSSREAIDFLEKCLRMNPEKRLSAHELLSHDYFTNDEFSVKFLVTLRAKVEAEFSSPLLNKFKSEILRSTDRADEYQKRVSQDKSRWSITLTESLYLQEHVDTNTTLPN